MKKILLLVGLVSSFAFGQDYYAPTDKDKEALARFPIELTVSGNTMSYELPEELTGIKNKIFLKTTDTKSPRIYSGDNAVATCMGEVANPGCVVVHKNLSIDRGLAETKINQRFADPELRSSSITIRDKFLEKLNESGNEPIGFIGSVTRRNNKDGTLWVQPTGVWSGYYQREKGAATFMQLNFANKSYKVYVQPTTPTEPGKWIDGGVLTLVNWSNFHASGKWEAFGTVGWFDFTFNAKSNKFEGTFGSIAGSINKERDGHWVGSLN